MSPTGAGFLRHRLKLIALIAVLAVAGFLYTHALTTNPAGFYIDESSIAYNAHLISQTGRDEHGAAWPLYFRAFGDYKNPVYIYLLAGIFRFTGPSILVARLFSAAIVFIAAALLALLAWRITKSQSTAVLVLLAALLTPWLFELSRVVVEVALYPLLVAALLLVVHGASEKQNWTWIQCTGLAILLALLTYTYSIGRLLGPLLALGLLFFVQRARMSSIGKVWLLYLITLVPLFVFQRRHPGALSARYQLITFITPQTSYADDAITFFKHYLGNLNPWKMIVSGDPNAYQIAGIYGTGPVLGVVLILALGSIVLLLRRSAVNAWWCFVIYGLAVSIVPASLTRDYFHMLRLAAVPVFMLALTIPAVEWLMRASTPLRRTLMAGALVLILAQGLFFQYQFRAAAAVTRRLDLFDADYASRILPTASKAAGNGQIYLADAPPIPGYIQAVWYASLGKIPQSKLTVLAPDANAPAGAVVITTEDTCPRCEVLLKRWPYTIALVKGSARANGPLPAEYFRAEIRAIEVPHNLPSHTPATVRIDVKNVSTVTWLARERAAAPYQISAGNHWLDESGKIVANDDGRATLLQDLPPGQRAEFSFTINPPRSGRFILEFDVLQENVSWFGLKGSKTLRVPVTVE